MCLGRNCCTTRRIYFLNNIELKLEPFRNALIGYVCLYVIESLNAIYTDFKTSY